jgi:hypothetical protein
MSVSWRFSCESVFLRKGDPSNRQHEFHAEGGIRKKAVAYLSITGRTIKALYEKIQHFAHY